MRNRLFLFAGLLVAAPAAAQDYRFSKSLGDGARLEIENITGTIQVSRASGRTAEVTVTKVVKKGDGSLVKAIMEERDGGIRVCTVYLRRDTNRTSCNGDNNDGDWHGKNTIEVEMNYSVKVPAGARLSVDNVNGNVTVSGGEADTKIDMVNGNLDYEGTGASSLETVNGTITARFSRVGWEGTMNITTVNGAVELTFPASLSADVSGETVSGSIQSDFPVRIEKGWGPKSFNGRIGAGGRRIKIETVNGGIAIRKH